MPDNLPRNIPRELSCAFLLPIIPLSVLFSVYAVKSFYYYVFSSNFCKFDSEHGNKILYVARRSGEKKKEDGASEKFSSLVTKKKPEYWINFHVRNYWYLLNRPHANLRAKKKRKIRIHGTWWTSNVIDHPENNKRESHHRKMIKNRHIRLIFTSKMPILFFHRSKLLFYPPAILLLLLLGVGFASSWNPHSTSTRGEAQAEIINPETVGS